MVNEIVNDVILCIDCLAVDPAGWLSIPHVNIRVF
jgi:hypothetical protein